MSDSYTPPIKINRINRNFESEITDVKTVADIKRHLKNHDVSINEW